MKWMRVCSCFIYNCISLIKFNIFLWVNLLTKFWIFRYWSEKIRESSNPEPLQNGNDWMTSYQGLIREGSSGCTPTPPDSISLQIWGGNGAIATCDIENEKRRNTRRENVYRCPDVTLVFPRRSSTEIKKMNGSENNLAIPSRGASGLQKWRKARGRAAGIRTWILLFNGMTVAKMQ